jgi:hypothetical protein
MTDSDTTADKRRGVRLFVAFMALFWISVWAAMVVKAVDLGHGLGPGHGAVYPCGQSLVRGTLDGEPAVPAQGRWDATTGNCRP